MNLVIKRQIFTPVSTIGELTIEGDHFCWTLERPRLDLGNPSTLLGPDGKNHPCIDAGNYKTMRVWYEHLKINCFELLNVPGRSSILIHPANWARQLLGCIAAGLEKGQDYIGSSDLAFQALMKRTEGQDVEVDIS